MITDSLITGIIGLLSTVFASLLSYRTGKRQRENEAYKTAFEAYNFALESLRAEFEKRIEVLQRENEELRQRIRDLENR